MNLWTSLVSQSLPAKRSSKTPYRIMRKFMGKLPGVHSLFEKEDRERAILQEKEGPHSLENFLCPRIPSIDVVSTSPSKITPVHHPRPHRCHKIPFLDQEANRSLPLFDDPPYDGRAPFPQSSIAQFPAHNPSTFEETSAIFIPESRLQSSFYRAVPVEQCAGPQYPAFNPTTVKQTAGPYIRRFLPHPSRDQSALEQPKFTTTSKENQGDFIRSRPMALRPPRKERFPEEPKLNPQPSFSRLHNYFKAPPLRRTCAHRRRKPLSLPSTSETAGKKLAPFYPSWPPSLQNQTFNSSLLQDFVHSVSPTLPWSLSSGLDLDGRFFDSPEPFRSAYIRTRVSNPTAEDYYLVQNWLDSHPIPSSGES